MVGSLGYENLARCKHAEADYRDSRAWSLGRLPARSRPTPLFKGDIDIGIDRCRHGFRAPLKGFGVDIRQDLILGTIWLFL